MKIMLLEKLENGELVKHGERVWDEATIIALQHANYLLLNGKEYEMMEGRLNLDLNAFELLMIAVKGKE